MSEQIEDQSRDLNQIGCVYFLAYLGGLIISIIILPKIIRNFRSSADIYIGLVIGFTVSAIFYTYDRIKKGNISYKWSSFKPVWRLLITPVLFYIAYKLAINTGGSKIGGGVIYTERDPFLFFIMTGGAILCVIYGLNGLGKIQTLLFVCIDNVISRLINGIK